MARYWKRVPKQGGGGYKDGNHREIAAALEAAGCWVIDMSKVGGGFPDILVVHRGEIILMEIKNPLTQYGRKGLNPMQQKFSEFVERHGCSLHVVRDSIEALRLIGHVK